jgi:hypothetical protein
MSDYSRIRKLASHHRLVIVSGLVSLILVGLAGCGGMRLNSNWLDRHISIDGSADDWEGLLLPVDDGAAYVGIMNDSDAIYICVMTTRADLQKRLSRLGLFVSFQPEDHGKAPSGICYPVRAIGRDRMPRAIQTNEEATTDRPPGDRPFAPEMRVAEITGKSSQERTRISTDSLPGVEVKIGGQEQWFVYELRVPLAVSGRYPFTVDAKAGQRMTVRLQAEKPDMSRMRDHERGSGGPGSGGWGGGRRSGDGMGIGRGERGDRRMSGQTTVEFDVSAKVQLAPAPPI